jgi:hypothetical protein
MVFRAGVSSCELLLGSLPMREPVLWSFSLCLLLFLTCYDHSSMPSIGEGEHLTGWGTGIVNDKAKKVQDCSHQISLVVALVASLQ